MFDENTTIIIDISTISTLRVFNALFVIIDGHLVVANDHTRGKRNFKYNTFKPSQYILTTCWCYQNDLHFLIVFFFSF